MIQLGKGAFEIFQAVGLGIGSIAERMGSPDSEKMKWITDGAASTASKRGRSGIPTYLFQVGDSGVFDRLRL